MLLKNSHHNQSFFNQRKTTVGYRFGRSVFALPKYSAVISGEVPVETLGITGMLELKEELDEVRENFAAHMLLAICPNVNTNVLNFVGRQRTITTSEVVEYVERILLSTPPTPLPLFLLRLLLLRQQCMAPNLTTRSQPPTRQEYVTCVAKSTCCLNVQH